MAMIIEQTDKDSIIDCKRLGVHLKCWSYDGILQYEMCVTSRNIKAYIPYWVVNIYHVSREISKYKYKQNNK